MWYFLWTNKIFVLIFIRLDFSCCKITKSVLYAPTYYTSMVRTRQFMV